MIREAAAKPGLGLAVGHGWDFTGVDRQALHGPSMPDEQPPPRPRDDASMLEQLMSGSLVGILLPHLNPLLNMSRLLTTDTELAWEEGDHERILSNLATMLGMARHTRETPIMINSMVGVSFVSMACTQTLDLLHRDPERFTRAELTQLAHLLASADALVQPMFEGERMFMMDTLQRLYGPHGRVTLSGLQVLLSIAGPHGEDPVTGALATPVGLPAAAMLIAPRDEMEREFDRFMSMLQAEMARPPWERLHAMRTDDAVLDLAGNELSRIRYMPVIALMPALSSGLRTSDRTLALRDAALTVIAMELHRRDHGTYPRSVTDLSPHYMPQPPLDMATGQPLRLRLTDDDGFILWLNGEDNGGVLSEDGERRWPGPERTGDWVLYPPVIRDAESADD